jgi:hypothetical protein
MDLLLALLPLAVAALNLATVLVTTRHPVMPHPPRKQSTFDDEGAVG